MLNSEGKHQETLKTDNNSHTLEIPGKPSGFGSSANGGELLFLALATCYCNDIYREAAKMNIRVEHVEVEVNGEFGTAGEPAKNIVYRAKVTAQASKEEIQKLMRHTDRVAEIQNTLRAGITVTLESVDAAAV